MSHTTNDHGDAEVEDGVPIFKADEKIRPRLKILADHFTSKYNVKPDFFVKVPGRVNLIGEHVDYCGYAVFPMAIEQDILVAVAVTDSKDIQLTNVDSKYKDFRCKFKDVGSCIENASGGPAWYKYFLCGVKGGMEVIPKEKVATGLLAAVWGNIPPNSGLSSSSALVSAALLLTVRASQYELSKRELATISASAERYIGTQGGGMDQAIAFLGKAGSAMLIEFNPLRASDVTLPESAVFVIAHSQACHNKASTADYNLRVAECRLAAQIIAKRRGKDWKSVQKLIDIQEVLDSSLDEMVSVVMTDLHQEPYTLDEITKILDITSEGLRDVSRISSFSESQTFKLRQRALHVFNEAARVIAFRSINGETSVMEPEKVRLLGSLMSKSHSSLQELYECSHPRVDALVADAMKCGALGARITGAGWGGCIVAITTKEKVSQFVASLREHISRNEIKDNRKPEDLVFPTEPNQGATIYTM